MIQLLLLFGVLGCTFGRSPEAFPVNPKQRNYNWVISRDVQEVGGRTLIVNTINGRVKGPAIFARQGETLSVKVTNNLPDAGLTIHWHGMEMKGYQLYDGPVGLVQCAIAPGDTMTYTFKVQEKPGTYWYHTHNEVFPCGDPSSLWTRMGQPSSTTSLMCTITLTVATNGFYSTRTSIPITSPMII